MTCDECTSFPSKHTENSRTSCTCQYQSTMSNLSNVIVTNTNLQCQTYHYKQLYFYNILLCILISFFNIFLFCIQNDSQY